MSPSPLYTVHPNHISYRESASRPVNPKGRERCDTTSPVSVPLSPSIPANRDQREPLATTFACLFCNHENSVVVKLDKKLGLGDLSCKVCGQKFQTGINCRWKLVENSPATMRIYSQPIRPLRRSRRLFRLGRRVRCRGQGKRQPIRWRYELAAGKQQTGCAGTSGGRRRRLLIISRFY